MTSERKLKLHDELSDARKKRRTAVEAMNEAKSVYLERKAEVRAATDVVEEILEEIETGKTRRPLLDLADRNGHDHPPGVEPARNGRGSPSLDPTETGRTGPAKRGRPRKAATG